MKWNFLCIWLTNLRENVMLEVLLSFNIFLKVMESVVFLLFSSEPICKGYSELRFKLKFSYSCRPCCWSSEHAFKFQINALLQKQKNNNTCNDFITFTKILEERCDSSITFSRRFASQTHKKFQCIILESVERKTSKAIRVVKKKYWVWYIRVRRVQ